MKDMYSIEFIQTLDYHARITTIHKKGKVLTSEFIVKSWDSAHLFLTSVENPSRPLIVQTYSNFFEEPRRMDNKRLQISIGDPWII